ncbi:PfkB family carbohydrate kinase [Cellulomonas soli]|uniref:Ribokinase n=1 Tax=Cellulomonas soli TaxID=931535 RepID=A0A512PB10_9CELL|nr:PfkB family carbohydrate kinase [Cellulomonas soli]NYI57364.1 sugar/nucleoside kinase (ribokinase family) [Cellulomonas soli]GEP68356.1 ribokinase [Cellulomonas soli]
MPTDVSSSSAQLVCCGLVTLDVRQVVDRLPGPDEKVVADRLAVAFGGPAANAAATAVALGVSARLVTALGRGALADVVRAGLQAAGVELVDLLGDEPGTPAVSTVLVTRGTGERAVVSTNATGTRALGSVAGSAAGSAAEEALDGATALLVDGHHMEVGTAFARLARSRSVPVLLDGGSWKDGTAALLAHVDHAVLSADFRLPADPSAPWADRTGAAPEGDALLSAVAALGPRTVARSAGPGPVRVLVHEGRPGVAVPTDASGRARSGSLRVIVPERVDPRSVVDTVGAGDVLHGATGAGLARGVDLPSALVEGVRWATASVRHAGALGWVEGVRGRL